MDRSVRGVLKINHFVLLIKRIKKDKLYFVFPAGHKKEEETDKETCKREFFEETSLKVEPIGLIESIKEGRSHTTIYFLCKLEQSVTSNDFPKVKIIGPELEKDPSRDYFKPLWIDISDLADLTIYPDSIVKMIIRGDII